MIPTGYTKNILEFNAIKGFTLLEIMITLVVLAILSSIAAPSFISFFKSLEAKEVHQNITDSFRTAKNQSLMLNKSVILCPADKNNVCHKEATDFLLIFSDQDDNKRFDNKINTILSKQPLNLDYGRIYLRAGRRNHIKFFADTGLPRGHFGHIKYCPNDGNTSNMYQISLNQHGNYRYKPYTLKPTDCP